MRTAIIQDPKKLKEIAAGLLTYDLNDSAFVRYFRDRTGYDLAGSPDPEKVFRSHKAGSPDNEPHIIITKGKLQDCWELYNQERGGK